MNYTVLVFSPLLKLQHLQVLPYFKMSDLSREIEKVVNQQSLDSEKIASLRSILTTIKETDIHSLKIFVDLVLKTPYGTAVATGLLDTLLKDEKSNNKELLEFLLQQIQTSDLYPEAEILAINKLVNIYDSEEDFLQSSETLESGLNNKLLSINNRFSWLVKIIRCRLELNDFTIAEQYLNKATLLENKLSNVNEELIHFKLAQARIWDSNRRFLEASRKYYEVSQIQGVIEEEDRMQCLNLAIVTAILAPAGPARSQHLRTIHNDERTAYTTHYPLFTNVHLQHLLPHDQVEQFRSQLLPHQKVELADGVDVLTRAVFDHNLQAVSRLYDNITLTKLAKILGLDHAKVETFSCKMIQQKRLSATIDQFEDIIYFTSTDDAATFNVDGELDSQIEKLCTHLDQIAAKVALIQ